MAIEFPNPLHHHPDWPVAVGGNLAPDTLLSAYAKGIFPWSASPITWWSPDPRGILPLDGLHLPKSLRRTLNQGRFDVTFDEAFPEVMAGCAQPAPGRESSWIDEQFVAAYTRLHALGHAHSVECWQGDSLVGGVYGVSLGGLFAGESMFHRRTGASKVALVKLAQHLRFKGFTLLDIQMLTPVTRLLGAVEVPRETYLRMLAEALRVQPVF